ncbi:MAG: hypothetical protein HOH58_09315 [Opitutaceae bacterium]|nr:hypothetical protein [Opitutaceae bacterium]
MASPSYIEACIAALPNEKQQRAREAFNDILEGRDDDGVLSRLLLVFEATSAFGRELPSELERVLSGQASKWEALLEQNRVQTAETGKNLEASITQTIEDSIPQIGEKLSVAPLSKEVDQLRVGVDRLNRQIHRQRTVRLSVVFGFMLLAAVAGAASVAWWFHDDFRAREQAHRQVRAFEYYGLSLELSGTEDRSLRVHIEGSGAVSSGSWLTSNGKTHGVQFVVPSPR